MTKILKDSLKMNRTKRVKKVSLSTKVDNYLRGHAKMSSIHGLALLVESENICLKLTWLIFILAAAVCAAYFIILNIIR